MVNRVRVIVRGLVVTVLTAVLYATQYPLIAKQVRALVDHGCNNPMLTIPAEPTGFWECLTCGYTREDMDRDLDAGFMPWWRSA